MTDSPRGAAPVRGKLYPVDHLAAASRAISLTSIVTARAPGDPEDVVAEVLDDHGERGLLALIEAQLLLLHMCVEDLVVTVDGRVDDVPGHLVGIFERYGEQPELVEPLRRMLTAVGGSTLDDARTLAETVAGTGPTPAWPLGLAKTIGMTLRLLEAGKGQEIDLLIEAAEDRMLTLQ